MKALFLCAGHGSRLKPLTLSISKHLIPIANKPILFYGLEEISRSGIKDVGIVVAETRTDIKEMVGRGSKWGLNITYITQDNPKGLAHAVKIAQEFIGDEQFIVYLGDNLLNEPLKGVIEKFTQNHDRPNAMVLLTEVKEPQHFGIAQLDGDGRIVRLLEKPKDPPTNLGVVGAYLFDKNIFKAIEAIRPSDREELEITDAIQYLIDKNFVVQSHIVKRWWKDTGRPSDIIEANRFMLETMEMDGKDIRGEIDVNSNVMGRLKLGQKSKIINSIIRGPVAIGENTIIENSFVGPFTSIGDNVRISQSEIEHSVVCGNSVIENIESRIDTSLIGRNVLLKRTDKKPKVVRFILGDNSMSELT